MKKLVLSTVLLIVLMGTVVWLVIRQQAGSENIAPQTRTEKSFDKSQHPLDEASSIWVIANKKRPLNPKDYKPADLVVPSVPLRLGETTPEMQLRRDAARALEQLVAGAQEDGPRLMLSSGYRSYTYQDGLYNGYVRTQGRATADTQSARAGYSEHQTGLAADLEPTSRTCEVEVCFGETPEGKWLAAHAHEYGFIIRYPQNKQAVTGYTYEPWHVRYVGIELAKEVKKSGKQTLEEFFDLEPAGDY